MLFRRLHEDVYLILLTRLSHLKIKHLLHTVNATFIVILYKFCMICATEL